MSVRVAGPLSLVLMLGACANPLSDAASSAQTALVGMPKATLLGCAGVPDRQVADGEREVFSYSRRRTQVIEDVDYEEFPWFGPGLPLLRPEVRRRTIDYACEATVTLRRGVVENVIYGEGRYLPLCGSLVENCLSGPKAGSALSGW